MLEADGGERALAVSERFPGTIDLLLTDVRMPGLGGLELAARLCARRPGLRVLYVSGYPGDGVWQDGMPLLAKPFRPAVLAEKVSHVLAQPLAA